MTVLWARQKLGAEVKHRLTEDDFASSQLLRLMRRTAELLADAEEETVTLGTFLREFIKDLSDRGGLVAGKVSSTVNSGHYALIWSWIQTFLVRNRDIIERSIVTVMRLIRKGVKARKARNGQALRAVPEDFKWPPRSTLRFYQGGRLLVSSNEQRLDLWIG